MPAIYLTIKPANMRKTLLLKKSVLFFFVMILLFAACNNENSSPAKTESLNITPNTSSTSVPTKTNLMTGYLDTLFIDSAHFELLGRPPLRGNWTIFRFYIDSSNYLTLGGWAANNGNGIFHANNVPPPSSPDVILMKANASIRQYGPGNYFGNLILRPNQLNHIQQLLRSTHSKSILFAPADPALNFNQITYNIILSDKVYEKDVIATYTATGETLNPSPPRNSN